MKVRCVECRKYVPREEAIRTGLVSFCSQECQKRAAQKRTQRKTSASKTSSKKQRTTRTFPEGLYEQALAADNYTCRFCGATNKKLSAHHIEYRSQGGEHVLENLISLCEECHLKIHSNKKLYQPLAFEIIANRDKPYTIRRLEQSNGNKNQGYQKGSDL